MIEHLLDLPLYRLELPTPFPVGPVNVYLVTEPEAVLLDTGTRTEETLVRLEKLLAEVGLRVEGLKKIVVTHGHLDHYGLAQVLADRSGAPVYASPLDGSHFNHHEKLDGFYSAMMEQAGVPGEVVLRIGEQFAGFRSLAAPLVEYVPIEQLGAIRCGPLAFQPIATPGHTQGSVSFFEPTRRILLSSDTVLKHITPNPILDLDEVSPRRRFRALGAYLETLQRIRELNPAIIYTGHGEPVENYPELHDRVLRHHQARKELILQCLRTGEHTVYQVGACLFPEPRTHNSFLAISEVFAHLDLLEEASECRKRFAGPVALYSV